MPGVVGESTLPGIGPGMQLRGALRPGTFDGRSAATKKKLLEEGGGTPDSEEAVKAGLNWLARLQNPDGSWNLNGRFPNRGPDNAIAGTAFGLLPFLGDGKTHKAAKDNPYDKPIEKALYFLMRKQDRRTGNFGGDMYSHCLATIAMCEAYGLTHDQRLRPFAQGAVNYLVMAQHTEGGWRYGPKQAGDTSVTGWAVMALKSGRMGGLDVPEVCFRKAIRYLDNCCDQANEGYGYFGKGSSTRMSSVGLLCRQYLQAWGGQHPRMQKGVRMMLEPMPPPDPSQKPTDMYYYYYATQVLHHFGGAKWKAWNEKMRDSLVRSQDKKGGPLSRGSWDPTGDAYGGQGRLMYTSLALLTLEVYYRHLPLYYRDEENRNVVAGP
jgi:hypothetical protein